jgi:hypothetical protein
MSVNARVIIRGALDLVGVTGGVETPNASDIETMLVALNMMIDSWNTERLSIYTVQDHVVPSFSGSVCTIGPGGMIDVPRPVAIEDTCFSRMFGIDYAFKIIDGITWSGIVLKVLPSTFPQVAYWDGNAPVGNLMLWPQPISPVELHVRLQSMITEFPDIFTSYPLPPGYRIALTYSLAEIGYSIFARPVDPNIVKLASRARRNIKRNNQPDDILYFPAELTGHGGRFNIYSGLWY